MLGISYKALLYRCGQFNWEHREPGKAAHDRGRETASAVGDAARPRLPALPLFAPGARQEKASWECWCDRPAVR